MLYDVHAHAFHPKIAHKVLEQLEEHYGIRPLGTGTADDLAARAEAAGLDRFTVLTAATTPDQVIPANNWALEIKAAYPRAVAFGSVHPGFAGWEAQLDRLERAGIQGLKIHPEFQGFRLDDPGLDPILESARGRFTVLVHVGDTLPPAENPSCPYKLMRLHERFPGLDIIAAHMGGYLHWKWALDGLIGSDVYIDTSSTLPFIDDATLAEIMRRHPRERILFGSDYPLFDPAEEAERIKTRLGFSQAEVEELMAAPGQLFD